MQPDRRARDEAETLDRLAGEHWRKPRRVAWREVAFVLCALLALSVVLTLALHQARQHSWEPETAGAHP